MSVEAAYKQYTLNHYWKLLQVIGLVSKNLNVIFLYKRTQRG